MEDKKYCAELEIMIKLKDNTKYYINLIKKLTSKRSSKYKKAYEIAKKIVTYLEFVEQTKNMAKGFMAKPCVTNNQYNI